MGKPTNKTIHWKNPERNFITWGINYSLQHDLLPNSKIPNHNESTKLTKDNQLQEREKTETCSRRPSSRRNVCSSTEPMFWIGHLVSSLYLKILRLNQTEEMRRYRWSVGQGKYRWRNNFDTRDGKYDEFFLVCATAHPFCVHVNFTLLNLNTCFPAGNIGNRDTDIIKTVFLFIKIQLLIFFL